ncbi:MAG: biotin/lipoyl-containing protein, partial [Rubrobacteraceae bacterium]
MAVEIHVPELGESVADATVGRWLKKEGEEVSAGDALVELETDKINFEVEAEEDGVLESIASPEGDTVNVGDVIGTIGAGDGSGESGTKTEEAEEDSSEQAEAEQPEEESTEEAEPADGTSNGHREEGFRASPAVRKLAEEYDLNLSEVSGSGSGGRITRDDVERLIRDQSNTKTAPEKPSQPESNGKSEQPAPAAENGRADLEERVRVSRRRQTIASRLVESQQTAAMLTTFNEVDMTAV